MASPMVLQTFALHHAQVRFLGEIARRAGDGMAFSWDRAREDVRGMVADLLQKELVRYVMYVSHAAQADGPTCLVLTDAGRRAVAQVEAAQQKQVQVTSDAPAVRVPVEPSDSSDPSDP